MPKTVKQYLELSLTTKKKYKNLFKKKLIVLSGESVISNRVCLSKRVIGKIIFIRVKF